MFNLHQILPSMNGRRGNIGFCSNKSRCMKKKALCKRSDRTLAGFPLDAGLAHGARSPDQPEFHTYAGIARLKIQQTATAQRRPTTSEPLPLKPHTKQHRDHVSRIWYGDRTKWLGGDGRLTFDAVWYSRPRTYGKGARAWYVRGITSRRRSSQSKDLGGLTLN